MTMTPAAPMAIGMDMARVRDASECAAVTEGITDGVTVGDGAGIAITEVIAENDDHGPGAGDDEGVIGGYSVDRPSTVAVFVDVANVLEDRRLVSTRLNVEDGSNETVALAAECIPRPLVSVVHVL